MMYCMKNIIIYDDEITLPKCMYHVKKVIDFNETTDTNAVIDLKICEQVIKFLKVSGADMTELENRQDHLLEKIDALYDRIMKISSICSTNNVNKTTTLVTTKRNVVIAPDEIVINANSDNLPWYLHLLLKKEIHLSTAWHVHSSVPKEKINKIKEFVKTFDSVANGLKLDKINLRLIFNNASVHTELRLSSLAVPIVGDVNILRYLSLLYPSTFPSEVDFGMDSLLDLCYLLQKSTEKSKEGIMKNLFGQHKDWIYNKQFSIVDIAAYNVIKQWKNCPKYVPSGWFNNCGQLYK